MPLKSGAGQSAISANIHELTQHGSRPRSHDQIVAIALHNADKYKHAKGGIADATPAPPQDPEPFHPGGLFHSDVAGRTDRLPHTVPADSFVFPADVVSALGQGNTLAGGKILDGILGNPKLADGGSTGRSSVIVAGGEYLAPRDRIADIGRRMRANKMSNAKTDIDAGHEWARQFVERTRKHQMDWLKKAPKPKK